MTSPKPRKHTALFLAGALIVALLSVLRATPAAAEVTTFAAVADTYVDANQPAATFGTATTVLVDNLPRSRTFLRFSVSGLTTPVTSAKLRLRVADFGWAGGPSGGSLHSITNTTWSESAVTWNTQPAIDGPVLGTLGATTPATWYEFDVTSAVRSNGAVSFAMTSSNDDGTYYQSRETTTGPQLLITTDTPPPADTVTFAAVADTYVDANQPAATFGTATTVLVDNLPRSRTFLRFSVSGLTTPVTSAKLRLRVADFGWAGGPSGGSLHSITNTTWSESAVTWNTQPAIDGPVLGTLGATTPATWYEFDVTSAVRSNGAVSFAMTSSNDDGTYYQSRETATGPQLLITTGGPPPADPVLVGAGDIASCTSTGDEATAALLDGIPGTVFTTGDNAYPNATAAEFANCYAPSWGRHKARTRPAAGNHEYNTAGATGYFGYFGAAAGDPAKGYYSYDLGAWHVVVVNSNCSRVGGCGAGSPQEQWVRQDLAASAKSCTVAIWHHPLFTSTSTNPALAEIRPIFQALYDFNADVVLAGHNHNYERFAPQTPAGALDTVRGIRQWVVGTGGASHYGFGAVAANSEVRNADTYGVLKLTLRATGYTWQFVPEAGRSFTDSGSGSCH